MPTLFQPDGPTNDDIVHNELNDMLMGMVRHNTKMRGMMNELCANVILDKSANVGGGAGAGGKRGGGGGGGGGKAGHILRTSNMLDFYMSESRKDGNEVEALERRVERCKGRIMDIYKTNLFEAKSKAMKSVEFKQGKRDAVEGSRCVLI